MRKQGLKFDWISNLNNFISNHRSLIKFTPFMEHFIGIESYAAGRFLKSQTVKEIHTVMIINKCILCT